MAEYYFRLPTLLELTDPQQVAINEQRSIALSGGPGTGKSVVSIYRHLERTKNNKNSLLLTYTTTLKMYLAKCCEKESDIAAQNVNTSLRGKPRNNIHFKEAIIDEAQDLPIHYYEDLKRFIKVSYGADDSQILYPENCSYQSDLKRIFPDNVPCVLHKNYRSTQRIMQFAKQAFEEAYIPPSTISNLINNVGELPVMLISERNNYLENERRFETSNPKQDSTILKIIHDLGSDTHNIAILVPWKRDAIYFEEKIKDAINDFSIYYEDDNRFPNGAETIKNMHITTFKSSKGLEFDTVIIPNFDNLLKRVPIKIKVKTKKDGEEIEEEKVRCTWKDLYVAVTRARSNLYLITNNDMPFLNSVTDKQRL